MNYEYYSLRAVYKDVTIKFLGNTKDPDYKNIIEKMLRKFKILGCSKSIKIHFLHKDFFPENLVIEE